VLECSGLKYIRRTEEDEWILRKSKVMIQSARDRLYAIYPPVEITNLKAIRNQPYVYYGISMEGSSEIKRNIIPISKGVPKELMEITEEAERSERTIKYRDKFACEPTLILDENMILRCSD